MAKKDLIRMAGRKILMPIGLIQVFFVLVFVSSPFFWIWDSWGLAWRIALTGLIGAIILRFIYSITETTISEKIDEMFKESAPIKQKSKFQRKLEEMQNQHKQQT